MNIRPDLPKMTRLIVLITILMISNSARCQTVTRVEFGVGCYKEVVKANSVPTFVFSIYNNNRDSLIVPLVYRIIRPGDPLSNINAEIQFEGAGKAPGPLTCNVDDFTDYVDENGEMSVFGFKKLKGYEEYMFVATIDCFDFSKIGNYRIRFSLDKSKTKLEGTTGWITLNVIK